MFTGLVEGMGFVKAIESLGSGLRLVICAPSADWVVEHGASVAVLGCCLTVIECRDASTGEQVPVGTAGADMVFDLSAETLECTRLGDLAVGDVVNLERALAMGARLGGHIVSGHVDGAGQVALIEDSGDGGRLIYFAAGEGFERFLVDKGSVTVDGISLTVVRPSAGDFCVAVIPETLRATNLGRAKVGDRVHLEADQLGKWVAHLMAPYLEQLGG